MKKLFLLAVLTLGPCFFTPAQIGVGVFPGPGGDTNSKPARSGFYGQSLVFSISSAVPVLEGEPAPVGTPWKAYISVYDKNGKLVERVVSNRVGQFYSFVKPGNYTLLAVHPGQPRPPRNLSDYVPPDNSRVAVAVPVSITVNTNQLTQLQINFWIVNP